MSTKFILDAGRSLVHAALLKCVVPFVAAQEIAQRPELACDPEQLDSKVKSLAYPLVDEMVEVLAGNEEGSHLILRASILEHKAAHQRLMERSTGAMLDAFLDAIFPTRPQAGDGRGARKPTTAEEKRAAYKDGKLDAETAQTSNVEPNDAERAAKEERFEKLLKSLGINLDASGDDEPTVHAFDITKEQAERLKDPAWIAKALGLDKHAK